MSSNSLNTKNNKLSIPKLSIGLSNYEENNPNLNQYIFENKNLIIPNSNNQLSIPNEEMEKLTINNNDKMLNDEICIYNINIIKDNEKVNIKTQPKLKQQNDAFLNLNKLYPLNRSNSFGSNKQSDCDNSPIQGKKINFMMKNFFNQSPSQISDKENENKHNTYLSPIQQYFSSSPKIIDNSLNENDFDFNKNILSNSYNNSNIQEKEEYFHNDSFNNSNLNDENQINNNKIIGNNNDNEKKDNVNNNDNSMKNFNYYYEIEQHKNDNNININQQNLNNNKLHLNQNYPFTNEMNINFNYNTNINMGINDTVGNINSNHNNLSNQLLYYNNINQNNLNDLQLHQLNNYMNNTIQNTNNISNNIILNNNMQNNNMLNNNILNNNNSNLNIINNNDSSSFNPYYFNFKNQYPINNQMNMRIKNNTVNNFYQIMPSINDINLNMNPSYQIPSQSYINNPMIYDNNIQMNYYLQNKNILSQNNSIKFQKPQNNTINQININNNKTSINKTPKSKRILNTSTLYKLDNSEIAKQSYNLAKDQIGCRFLQKKIEEDTQFSLNSIYPIILEHLLETITDQFGNYLIQKFFEYLNTKELCEFLSFINSSFANIGINQYGTRVIQKLMDYIKNDEEKLYETFVNLIKPNIILFSNDINGCHIIQKIMLTKNFNNDFCYEKLDESIEQIANHKNGCCFLQKCCEKIKGNELEKVLNALNKKTRLLIVDQYGNYVIQYIIKINGNERNENIFNVIIKDLTFYSNQKFSSNVLEKFFLFDNLKEKLIDKIMEGDNLKKMLFDLYGNYVVQKALLYCDVYSKNQLLYKIAPLLEELKTLNFGLKLYHKLTIKYPCLLNIVYSNDF
jgi:hypothetical protein